MIIANCQTLLELLDGLQKTRESQPMHNFLATCYKLAFRYSDEVKPIIGSLVIFLCEKKPNLPFSSASEFKVTILNIFNSIKNDKTSSAVSLLNNYKLLLRPLDLWKTELTFNEHRLYIEFLCSLVYKIQYSKFYKTQQMVYINESRDALKDHLNMLVVKHINNPDEKIMQLGIIGAVKIVSALVIDSLVDSEFTENQAVTIEDIPRGPIREAAELVDLMMSAANQNYEILTMLYDELSYEFKPKQNDTVINQMFLTWLGDIALTKLENLVTIPINTQLPEYDGIVLCNKFEMTDDEFENSELSINLGKLVFEKSKEVVIVPSLFKLTRTINLKRFGNVDFMAGLISMPITLPDKFGTEEDFLNDDEETAKLQLDLYFYTCNWMREIIGGFLQSTEEKFVKQLIKKRLKQLIRIEKQLDVLLKKAPLSYLPPYLNFLQYEHKKKTFEGIVKSLEKKSTAKPTTKKSKKDETANDTLNDTTSEKDKISFKSSQFCREMDNDVALLLNESFKLTISQSDDTEFTLAELIYLLDDVHNKFSSIFKGTKIDAKGFSDEIKSMQDIKSHILPYLVKIFTAINKEIEDMSRNSMETDDAEGAFFTDEGLQIKQAYDMILKIFNVLYGSKKLKLDDNSDLLNGMLKLLLEASSSHLRSQEVVCSAIIEQYMEYEKNIKDIKCAVGLIDFMCLINSFAKDKTNAMKICDLSERFLKIRWKNANRQLEHGSLLNSAIEKLLKIYVKRATNLEQIENLVAEIEEATNRSELMANKTFPCITKVNLIFMLRVYIQRFSEHINATKAAVMTFDFWMMCTKLEEKFIAIVKRIKSMAAFNLFLKNFIVYLKKFNIDGMTILNDTARRDCQKFIQLVKDIQRIRRTAHGVACELKHRKNGGIAAILPTARQQFEIFYHSAANIAKQVNISSEYLSVGTLRNFNIDGEDIFSQNTTGASTQCEPDEQTDEEEDMEVDNDRTPDLSLDEATTSDDEDPKGGTRVSSFRSRSTIL